MVKREELIIYRDRGSLFLEEKVVCVKVKKYEKYLILVVSGIEGVEKWV